ncbi:ankyrin [Xylaria nigripes]|nr:ankyrin [Xylaria nigripes]
MVLDPLSTVASALQIYTFATGLLKSLSRFIERTKNIKDSIRELYDELSLFKGVIHDINRMLEDKSSKPLLPFEVRHHGRIRDILKSCCGSLNDLDQSLPQLKEEETAIEKLRLSIQTSLKGERHKDIIHHIISYTRLLQLSLTAVSICDLWASRISQKVIMGEMKKLRRAIHEEGLLSGRIKPRARSPPRELPVLQAPRPHTPPADEESSMLEEQIRCWRETVDDIEAAVSFSTFENETIDHFSITSSHRFASRPTLPASENEISDSEGEELDQVRRGVMELALQSNQEEVQQLMQCNIYFRAAACQRSGIKKCKRLLSETVEPREQDGVFGQIPRLANMEEMLVDILSACNTAQTDKEAEEVLIRLLEQEESPPPEMGDTDRQWRLCYKLGNLYARQGIFSKARKHLEMAFYGRSNADPRQKNLVVESAEMLTKIFIMLQRIDDARGIQRWVEKIFPLEPSSDDHQSSRPSPRASMGADSDLSPFLWSEKQGFNIRDPHFGFDVYHSGIGKAPIHLAIQHQNVEMLQSMLNHVAHVEQPDSTGSTPLHHAATTRNKRLCSALLEKDANVDVVDQNKRTPLHKCQSNSGGVQVAGLILNRCPSLIDRIDCFGKTALYMACEKGNEMMASVLLSRGANPNGDSLRQYIPLVSAIDSVAQSSATIRLVKLLLDYGAGERIRDGSGRTAFDAANNAGLAAREIKKLLGENSRRRSSIASMASAMNTTWPSVTSEGIVPSSSTESRQSASSWLRHLVPKRPQG